MRIIPVIDLMDGCVVHARQGKRDQYRPIGTPLCPSSDIGGVISAFLNLYDFDTFYIADLNSIGGRGDHDASIGALTHRYPGKVFWIDRGYRSADLTEKLPANHLPVLGSESMDDRALSSLRLSRNRIVLSLDYSIQGPMGARSLFTDPGYWPDTVIVMTLARVGSGQGPDFALLKKFCGNYPNKHFVAAGGIRNKQDLIGLKKLGIGQALVASALHSGAIGSRDIAEVLDDRL